MSVSVIPLPERPPWEPLFGLSLRELDVLTLVAQGYSNAGIAAELYLGVKTVETHVGNIFRKLCLPEGNHFNRRVLAAMAHLTASERPDRVAA